jgi:hypothetical protein
MRRVWCDASLERVDEDGIDDDDELTYSYFQQMLLNIVLH